MARDFVEEGGFIAIAGGPEYREKARAMIRPLATMPNAARKTGVAVVYLTDCHTPDDSEMHKWPPRSTEGSEWSGVVSDLAPQDGDLVIPKATYSGFQSSDIEEKLRSRGIETLYIAGLHADCCCRRTSGDAFQKWFDLVWVTDALKRFTGEAHDTWLEYFKAWYATDPDRQSKTSGQVVADWSQ